jgi:magnesium and cobalt transporter
MLKLIKKIFFDRLSFTKNPRNSSGIKNVELPGKHIVQKEISFNLHNQRVDDVAIPKADIVAAPDKITLSELTKIFRASNLTRLPIFRNTLDNPIGFVHLKDLALRNGFGKQKKFNITDLIRPLIYVPPSMTLGTLLQKMQAERIHMSLVIDEYGGVEGLLTIEDLLEQIVGEINDEHELKEDLLWSKEKDFIVNARLNLEDFKAQAGVDLTKKRNGEEYDTIGGLVFNVTNRIPSRGEVVTDSLGNEFSVLEADPRSIKRLRLNLRS